MLIPNKKSAPKYAYFIRMHSVYVPMYILSMILKILIYDLKILLSVNIRCAHV